MATRLSPLTRILMLSIASLASCTTAPQMLTSANSFCETTKERLPIIASRKDKPQTLRQIAILNAIHEENCLK